LLYVEPVYLKAESSPMPELRLVVLATQDGLGYGQTFEEAMRSIFGDVAQPTNQRPPEPAKEGATAGASPKPGATPNLTGQGSVPATVQQLLDKAVREFDEYQRLTSQGKLGEAGQKLEQHKRTLDDLKRALQTKP
jgi:uncharacterized membrane protein (UPF0182 family)